MVSNLPAAALIGSRPPHFGLRGARAAPSSRLRLLDTDIENVKRNASTSGTKAELPFGRDNSLVSLDGCTYWEHHLLPAWKMLSSPKGPQKCLKGPSYAVVLAARVALRAQRARPCRPTGLDMLDHRFSLRSLLGH